LSCGHRGFPNRNEEKRISRLLRKSGFIPLLDGMPQKIVAPEVKSPTAIEKHKDDDSSNKLIVDVSEDTSEEIIVASPA